MTRSQARFQGHLNRSLKRGSHLPLGARVEGAETLFRLFAPRASRVIVDFYKHLEVPDPASLRLQRHEGGVWEARYPADLHGWYYFYRVEGHNRDPSTHFNKDFRVLDPYAVAAVGPAGPGIVWDLERSIRPASSFTPPRWHDLVILEAHVRDLIGQAPVDLDDEQRRGFTGLRKWVDGAGCYLQSLGVNAIELQPIQEFGDSYDKTTYHWGYMPTNFFAPESSYALAPENGSQIGELQELVSAFHRHGIAVLLDVVYNHNGEPNHLYNIDKGYYFQLDHAGNLTNWSGCGNDLRCDTPMGRRLIIDSLTHLVETYDVDGFRFDLAEIIGVEVLSEVETALKRVKPSIILIAEPWSFRGHIALDLKATGFASWNDGYRDFLSDYVLGQGNQEGLRYFMGGSLGHLSAWPAQTVNYVESHDDHCWIDKITENPDRQGTFPTPNDRRRSHLMVAVLMSSLGIPMLAAGQDLLRSKGGIRDTYRAADVNAIDYQRLLSFSGTHEYFRRWIHFRLSDHGRPLRPDIRPSDGYLHFFGAERTSAIAVLFNADWSQGVGRLLFAVNPHHETVQITLNDLPLEHWRQIADQERFEVAGLDCALIQCIQQRLELPPMSCGLWVE